MPDYIILRTFAGYYDVAGMLHRSVDLTVISCMRFSQKMGPAQEGEIVDGDDRRDAAVQRRDKICAVKKV